MKRPAITAPAPAPTLAPTDVVPLYKAREILKIGRDEVVALCESGVLPCRREGHAWRIEREPIERLAEQFEEQRRTLLTFNEVERRFDIPAEALERLTASGCLRLVDPADAKIGRAGWRPFRFVRRADVEAFVADYERNPDSCPGCGATLKIGRVACNIACATALSWPEVGREARLEKISRAVVEWWESPEGEKHRERRRAGARGLLEQTCWVCLQAEARAPSRVARAKAAGLKSICQGCRTTWLPFSSRAQWLAGELDHAAPVEEAREVFLATLEIGQQFEAEARKARPPRRGRHRDALAIDFAIDVMASRGFTDEAIETLLAYVHAGYVKQRRKLTGIRAGKAARDRAVSRFSTP
jgi:hypothetical protein